MKRLGIFILQVLAWLIIAYGTILGALTLLTKTFGGPLEPPQNMAWSEFKEYRNSGHWFWESMALSASCILLSSLILYLSSRVRNKKGIEPGDTPNPHSPSAQGAGGR